MILFLTTTATGLCILVAYNTSGALQQIAGILAIISAFLVIIAFHGLWDGLGDGDA